MKVDSLFLRGAMLAAFLTAPSIATAGNADTSCRSLPEVRANIDRVDSRIVALLAERGRYVREAARFKRDAAHVEDRKRVEAVIARVRHEAVLDGAPPDVVEATYRALIAAYTEEEKREISRVR